MGPKGGGQLPDLPETSHPNWMKHEKEQGFRHDKNEKAVADRRWGIRGYRL